MKKLIFALLAGMGIICSVSGAKSKGNIEFTEHSSREFTLTGKASQSTLYIYNISGFIKVEGYSGNKILIEMDKTLTADNSGDLETAKKEFRLAFGQVNDSIIAYIAAPFDSRPRKHWHYDNDREVDYNFTVDFTVKVPENINLHISTVNDGLIVVNNVAGNLHVSNVNDRIEIKNARGTTFAHTINGDVKVTYLNNPPDASSYYTINGDINVGYQPDLSADLQFKSMNGEFFTDFTGIQMLPASVTKEENKKGDSKVYKLNAQTSVRFGKGGKTFKFETLNGNIYIKKQS
jgi:hypothetical protein